MLNSGEWGDPDETRSVEQQFYDFLADKNVLPQSPPPTHATNQQLTVSTGDYMLVYSHEDEGRKINAYHGFIIVGWGKIRTCDEAFTTRNTLFSSLLLTPELAQIGQPVNYEELRFVPYIADFSLGPNAGQTEQKWLQYPGSRPFYCARTTMNIPGSTWSMRFSNLGEVDGSNADIYFYTIPHTTLVPSDRLYAPYFDCYNYDLCMDP
jgi:hypothetical protein